MPFKFEKLEVWQLALEYIDLIYKIAEQLPRSEEYNLKSQMTRAATSIALNIAEGSTGQTDAEQARFLGLAIRSLLETVACQHIIKRRQYLMIPKLCVWHITKRKCWPENCMRFAKELRPNNIGCEKKPLNIQQFRMRHINDEGRWMNNGGVFSVGLRPSSPVQF